MTYDKDKIRDRRIDRVAGAMYGVAVGDALGGPLEFMAEAEIKENKRAGGAGGAAVLPYIVLNVSRDLKG